MATSSVRSLHQPIDYVTGDESGYGYRDGSGSAAGDLSEKNRQIHVNEFKVDGVESNELHVEKNSSASGEHNIFSAGSAPNNVIQGTES